MNKLYSLIILFLISQFCNGQNLVPNYSFENLSSCPTAQGQIILASPWNMPSNTGSASTDLYNVCNTLQQGVPANAVGYQNAHTGVGYAGIYTFGYFDCREYMQVQLTAPLTAGTLYRAEIYVSPSESAGIAADGIEIYFSTGPVSGTGTYLPLPFVPQISNPANNIISDTLGWTLVSGYYTASGGENYITIGNFLSDFNTDTLFFNTTGWGRGYYRIDDVSVFVATDINELTGQKEININPNPFSDELNISFSNNDQLEFTLYDIASRKLLNKKFTNTVSLNTRHLSKGIYFYEVKNNYGLIKKGKLVKE